MPSLIVTRGSDKSFEEVSIGYKYKQKQKQTYSSNNNDRLTNSSNMESCHDNAAIKKPFTHLLNSFPKQLMTILSKKEYEDIISWTSDGKSFFIYDKTDLNEILLSCYFQSTKFDSFRRRLHRWGFRVAKTGINAGAYYHELFLRDDPHLCSKMKCASNKGNTKKFRENSYTQSDKEVDTTNTAILGETEENTDFKAINENIIHQTKELYSLKTCNNNQMNNIFEEYVKAMHINFWSRRPHLLECSNYLQQHGALNYLQSLKISQNQVLEDKTKEEDVSNQAENGDNENKNVENIPKIQANYHKTYVFAFSSYYAHYKSVEGSTNLSTPCDKNMKLTSNRAPVA